jgi:TolB-like protein
LKGKLDLDFDDLGEIEVKNIEDPIRAFSIILNEKAEALAAVPVVKTPPAGKQRLLVPALAVLVLVLVAVIAAWQPWAPDFEPVDPAAMIHPLPAKPSIAVLAFDDLSQGADQGYLSDAISEGVITELSHFSEIFVIARNSSFFYKGKATDVRDIARELGVRYVLEGSQQKAGDRLRVTVQLIDAVAGNHIWAETYDRDLVDIFAVQDEITRTIVATLEENIDLAEYDRLLRQPTESLGAYELVRRGRGEWLKFTPEGNEESKLLAEKALELDPNYSEAYIRLFWAHINCFRWGWCETHSREESLGVALEMARKAVELDPFSHRAHWVLANGTMQSGDLDQAIAEYDRAIELNPNSASVRADSIETLVYVGRAEDAISRTRAAIRLNPYHPDWYLWNLGWAQYFAAQYEDALASLRKMNKTPNGAQRTLAPVLVRLGRLEEAQAVIAEFRKNEPGYSLADVNRVSFEHKEYLERWTEDLRSAGLPE